MPSTPPPMTPKRSRARNAARAILAVSAILLPTLSLLPLGSLYLWEKGWLLYWAGASLVAVALITFVQWRLLAVSQLEPQIGDGASEAQDQVARPNPVWNAAEEDAWRDVERLARSVNIDKLTDIDAVLELGQTTLKTVAHRLHPQKQDVIWEFTVPQALAITERVSRRLSGFVNDIIPFGDRLTIAQVLAIYRWRSVADFAEKAYDVWRLVRLANPAAAVTHEARERLSKAMMQWGRAHVTRQLAETYVREIGRAAIDLYGGRLRITPTAVDASWSALDRDEPIALGGAPLRVLVSGSTRAVRDRVVEVIRLSQQRRVEALAALLQGDETKASAAKELAVLAFADTVELSSPRAARIFGSEAHDADVIVWIIDGHDTLSMPSDAAVAASRQAFRDRGGLLPPEAVIVVVRDRSQQDPVRDRVLQAALEAAKQRLKDIFGRPHIVTTEVSLTVGRESADARAILAALTQVEQNAERVQLVRRIEAMKNERSYAKSGWQALSATGALAKSIVSGLGARLGF